MKKEKKGKKHLQMKNEAALIKVLERLKGSKPGSIGAMNEYKDELDFADYRTNFANEGCWLRLRS